VCSPVVVRRIMALVERSHSGGGGFLPITGFTRKLHKNSLIPGEKKKNRKRPVLGGLKEEMSST